MFYVNPKNSYLYLNWLAKQYIHFKVLFSISSTLVSYLQYLLILEIVFFSKPEK